MKNICNEEKSLKRYLKNHISLNVETMVKFLITGTIAISLTACGGGGGGGSDSSNPVPPIVKPEDPNMGKPEDSILPDIGVDKAWDLEKEVQKLDGEKFTQLLSEGKIYEKDGKYYVVIDEENKVAQEVVVDPNMGKPEDSILPDIGVDKAWDLKEGVQELEGSEFNKLLSEGKIYEKDGKYYIVIDEENKIAQEVSSKGNITGEQDVILEENKEHTDSNTALYKVSNSTVTVSEETTLAVKGDEAAAIYAVDSIIKADLLGDRTTVVENKGIIEITGHNSVGMVSKGETTKVVNSGLITGISEDREDNKTYIHGMAAVENGLAENNGSIKIEGTGVAMLAKDKGTVVNDGNIVVEGNGVYLTDSDGNILKDTKGTIGIKAENGATGINNKKIETIGSFNNGMYAENKGTIINNGEIKSNSSVVYVDDSGINQDGEFIEERGMGFSFESIMEGRENSYIENNGSLTGEGSVFGVVSRFGSEGVNKGDINLIGKIEKYEGTEEILNNENGTQMVSFAVGMRARDSATSINEGNINIIGGSSRGIDVRRQSEGINNGNIYLESSEYLETYKWIDEDGKEQIGEELEHTWVAGMRGDIESKATNEKNIHIKGNGVGLSVSQKSEGINKGEIHSESVEYKQKYSWIDENGIEHTEERIGHTWVMGMEAQKESNIKNEKNIYIKGNGAGLRATENSSAVNNGVILGESIVFKDKYTSTDSNGNIIQNERDAETYIVGMEGTNNSTIENNGKIQLDGSGSGMSIRENSTAKNNGLITATGKGVNGVEIMGSGEFINSENGSIEVKSTEYHSVGIRVSNNLDSLVSKVENHGKIKVEKDNMSSEIDIYSGASVIGIDANGGRKYDEEGNLLEVGKVNVNNTGLIHVVGNKGVGISVNDGDLKNSGEILLEGKSTTALKIAGQGKLANTAKLKATGVGISAQNWDLKQENNTVENEGEIIVTGNGELIKNPTGDYYNQINAAKGIEGNGTDIYNSGNIIATGDGAYLEYESGSGIAKASSQAAQGIYVTNSTIVKNDGNIVVTGESEETWNGAKGVYVTGKSNYNSVTGSNEYEKATVENNGTIQVNGKYGVGIGVQDGDLINTGKIEVSGVGSAGITISKGYLSNLSSKIENEGDITVIGDGTLVDVLGSNYKNEIGAAIGIKGIATDIYNSGKIEVSGDAKYENNGYPQITSGVRGIKIENPFYGGDTLPDNKVLENIGDIILTGKGQIKGIETGGVDILNTGNITINNGKLETNGFSYGHTLGIDASAVKNFKNTGNIKIIKEGEETYLGATGIKIASSTNSIDVKTFENTGSIDVLATNGVGIETDGNIVNTGNISINGEKGIGLKLSDFSYSGIKIENEGDITIQGNSGIGIYANTVKNSGDITLIGDSSVGIKNNTSGDINHTGKIVVEGNNSHGIIAAGYLDLNGKIIMTGDNNTGILLSNGTTSPGLSTIELTGKNVLGVKYVGNDSYEKDLSVGIRIDGEGTGLELESGSLNFKGEISINGSFDSKGSVGILTKYNSSINNSNGYINMHGKDMIGIKAADLTNIVNGESGVISISGESAIGIVSDLNQFTSSIVKITNDGLINIRGNSGYEESSEIVTGIQAFNYVAYNKGLVTNNGKIEVESSNDGRGIDSFGNDVINNGIISIKGTGTAGGVDSNAIRVQGLGAIAINNGTINVDGIGAWGMYAGRDGTAINSKEGVINVSATAEGGMVASGGTAINHGTINIEDGNSNTNIVEVDKNGNEIIKSAMYATNGGTIENYGTINSNGNLTLGSSNGGAYMIGTNEDGSYGKITAKNVAIDGDVVVSAGITKNGFKNEYTMQNVVDAEDITLGENFNFTSNSLLYDAEAITDRWGNLDATLSRNDKTLSDFTTGYITSTANIFGKYQNEESFKTLSSDAKEVIKAIDTSSIEAIDKSLNDLTPTIYSNLGRQMLETNETFKEQDIIAINSLGENSYNFTFVGEYNDVDSRDSIEGYKSKISGFIGAINLGDGIFGTIGYGYNGIDYKDNGKGHIQTIHLGLNRFMKYQGVDFRLGLGGEYNFHENKRDINLVNRRAESNFDSYGVRASGEVSKVFGEKGFVKPYLGFDLTHMKYDSFTESNANSLNATVESESYTSALPKVGLLLGDKFGGLDLFVGVEYSYELGNINKEQEFTYEGFSGRGELPKDNLECGTTGIKAGVNYEVNSIALGLNIGKNFGRRDNTFVNASLGYKF